MAIEIFWTKFAQDKLDRIYVYYKNAAGDKVAKKLIQNIIKQTIHLAKHPEMGQKEILLSNRPETFRYMVYKNYKIIYHLNTSKKRIDIVNVFGTRQNPEKINDLG